MKLVSTLIAFVLIAAMALNASVPEQSQTRPQTVTTSRLEQHRATLDNLLRAGQLDMARRDGRLIYISCNDYAYYFWSFVGLRFGYIHEKRQEGCAGGGYGGGGGRAW